MAGESINRFIGRLNAVLPFMALALLLAAWGTFVLGRSQAHQLDLSGFGRCEDVYDRFARDGYVARFMFPYLTAALLMDGLATVALVAEVFAGRFRLLYVLALVLWLPTCALHGLTWFAALVLGS